jgi:hypothetical protein
MRPGAPNRKWPKSSDLKGRYNKTPFQVNGNIGQLSGILNPKELIAPACRFAYSMAGIF